MCGINILYSSKSIDRDGIIKKMNHSISHRGPDNSDFYSDDYISLGHTRLSIVGLSNNGNQPMFSNNERYIIVFNGEIYNFNELKSKLNYNFTTTTDTEVVLASYLKWGEKCVNYFNGMFAFAIWDKFEKELFVARDRLGIKPLYYYFDKSTFIFSSEIRSILRSNLVDKKLCIQGLNEYLKYQTVNYPNTIIRDIKVLEPASSIVFRNYKIIKKSKYWFPNKKPIDINGYSYNKLKNKVLQELTTSVELRMFSDVDSGAFLSGGVDSSTMVGLMSKLSNKKIKTFNISFDDNEYSESKYARLVSKQFNTDHTEINLKPEDFLNYIPNALNDMDHPSGDGPNSWVVSKFTREQGVKMVFSGLGGDELFAGYKSFKRLKKLNDFKFIQNSPNFLKNIISKSINTLNSNLAAAKIENLLKMNKYDFKENYLLTRQSLLDSQLNKILKPKYYHSNINDRILINDYGFDNSHFISKVSTADFDSYMNNVLLRDTDQMSMAHGLEVRVPFLDHNLVDLILAINDKNKYPKTTKKLLIDSLQGLLPKYVYDRPKMGFTFPWEKWLKNELFEFSDNLIKSLSKRKFFNQAEIENLWLDFCNESPISSFSRIWPLIVLEYWLEKNEIND